MPKERTDRNTKDRGNSEDRWTPGQWVAVQREFGYPRVEGGPIERVWDVTNGEGIPVAGGTIARENAANAHLIAAAPDLAEVARVVAGDPAAEREHENHDTGEADCCAWVLARAALARALGNPDPERQVRETT